MQYLHSLCNLAGKAGCLLLYYYFVNLSVTSILKYGNRGEAA